MAYVYTACTVYVTILVLAVNSDRFQFNRVTRSYSSHLFLCALDICTIHMHPRIWMYTQDGLREGGAVVDLTNDSGVEDEDVVDLTSPIQVSLTFEPIAIVNS